MRMVVGERNRTRTRFPQPQRYHLLTLRATFRNGQRATSTIDVLSDAASAVQQLRAELKGEGRGVRGEG